MDVVPGSFDYTSVKGEYLEPVQKYDVEYTQTGKDIDVQMPTQDVVEIKGEVIDTSVPSEPDKSRLKKLEDRKSKLQQDLLTFEDELDRVIASRDKIPGEDYEKRIRGIAQAMAATRNNLSAIDIDIDKEKYPETFMGQLRKGLHEQKLAEAKGLGTALVRDIPRMPAEAVKGAGRLAYKEYLMARQVGTEALAPAAEAFGRTAGVGVTEALRGVRDIIEEPQREFHVPPGWQKTWTGSEYVYRPVPTYPLEPWAVSKALGVGMPPGVDVRVQGQSAVPVRDVSRYWGPTGVVAPERGYGGVDYLWGVRDIEPQGFKPLLDMPKMPAVDISVPRWVTMPWLIPPDEVLYGIQSTPRAAVRQPMVRGVSRAGGVAQAQVPVRNIVPSKPQIYDYSSAKVKPSASARIPAIPRLPSAAASAKMQTIKLPKTVSRVIEESEGLKDVSKGTAEYAGKEAKLQSGIDYAERHNLPGSMGRYAMEQYGLVS